MIYVYVRVVTGVFSAQTLHSVLHFHTHFFHTIYYTNELKGVGAYKDILCYT